MKNKLVGRSTAKLAKKKGFEISCMDFIDTLNEKASLMHYIGDTIDDKLYMAQNFVKYYIPSQSLLKKWLREKYNIDVDVVRDIEIHYKDEVRWIVKVSDWNDIRVIKTPIADLKHPNHFHFIDFKSYESAMERGLYEALKLIKE
jgi:hypothetical protein